MERALPRRRLRKLRALADGWPDLLAVLRGRRRWIVSFSIGLWLVHLFQMWMFTVALSVPVPTTVFVSLVAVALMAGQLPFTIAGLGARDVALVVLLSPYMAPESAAALGVLVATRNLLPPLIGLPMMGRYPRFDGGGGAAVAAWGGASPGRCCMNTRCEWGGVARTSRNPPQEPHYRDAVEGPSHV